MKKYILYAGVNGSGKSTLYHSNTEIKNLPRVNTDEIVVAFGNWKNSADVIKAGKIAVQEVKKYFQNEESFVQETTLCGRSILENIKFAKSCGYNVILYFISVESAEIAKERVAKRVSQGGHGISDNDVERRYDESLRNIQQIIDYCDEIYFYDNTIMLNCFARIINGELTVRDDFEPRLFKKLNLNERPAK